MIFSSPVAQGSRREVYDDCIFDRHFAGCIHKNTLDPVIGKRECTTLVDFGHIPLASVPAPFQDYLGPSVLGVEYYRSGERARRISMQLTVGQIIGKALKAY